MTEIITLFHVIGNYIYADPDGHALGYDDVYTKLEVALACYAAGGLGAEVIDAMIH